MFRNSRRRIYEGEDVSGVSYIICYKQTQSRPDCDYYYKKLNGIRKCSSSISNCIDISYKYILNDECKESCNGYYQIEKETTDTPAKQYTECFQYQSEALSQANFCDENQKKCWTNFPTESNYYIKRQYSSSPAKYEVVKECENFYFEINEPYGSGNCFQCTNDCKTASTPGLFFIKGNKKCENSCSKFNRYYFDDSTNECFDSCESLPNKPFSDPPVIASGDSVLTPELCRAQCDTSSRGEYHNYNSHTCLSSCGSDGSLYLYYKNSAVASTSDKKICYPSCLDIPAGIYLYELSDHSCTNVAITNLEGNGYNFYYTKSDGVIKYVKAVDCKNKNYLFILGDECLNKCDESYYKIEVEYDISETTSPINQKFIKCFSTPSECLDTKSSTTSIIYYNEGLKKCWEGNNNIPNFSNYFLKKIDNYLYELVNECEFYYYNNDLAAGVSGGPGDGFNYCVTKCNDNTNNPTENKYFIRGNKKCLKKINCYEYLMDYYDSDNNECLDTCKGRPNNKFQRELTSSDTESIACLSACSSAIGEYYNFDSNICLAHCGADGSNYKYHADGAKICYPSCSDIPGGPYIYQNEVDTTNHVYTCYNSIPGSSCDYFYYENDGSKKCTTAPVCKEKNYNYLIKDTDGKNECRDRCDEYYKYDIEISNSPGDNLPFIKCFQTLTECYSYIYGTTTTDPIYYYEKSKRCWKDFPSDYFIKDKEGTSDNIYELVEKCDKYYYVLGGENICVNACKDITETTDDKYFIDGYQKCISLVNCFNSNKYYYDPDNHECIDSCKGRIIYGFQTEHPSTPTQTLACQTGCTGTLSYYNFDSNICLTKCGADGSNNKYHANGANICYPSCSDIPGNIYSYKTIGADNVYTCYTSQSDSGCTYYYYDNDGTKKCTDEKGCYDKNYIYLIKGTDDTECRDRCDEYYKYDREIQYTPAVGSRITLNFKQCFLTKEECLAFVTTENAGFTGPIYYHVKLKRC